MRIELEDIDKQIAYLQALADSVLNAQMQQIIKNMFD